MTEAPEREVLFMPEEQTEIGWQWVPDDALRWRAPVFNAEEYNLFKRTELDIQWDPPHFGSRAVRLVALTTKGLKISAAGASGMTILRILSCNGARGFSGYHEHAEFLSPLSILLRRLSDGDASRFEQGMRYFAASRNVSLQFVGNRRYAYVLDGSYYCYDAPKSLFNEASLLLYEMFRVAGRTARCVEGYYQLTDA